MRKARLLLTVSVLTFVAGTAIGAEEAASEPAVENPANKPAVESAASGDPEVRLSEGEVLEMASGEPAKAAAIYREVLDAPNLPDAVRARALYLFARCERKMGNLRSAEQLLEEIVKKYPKAEPSAGRAARLLKEIQEAGRGTGPADWLEGLRENESIQGQIFQLAMSLVAPDSDEGKAAAGKLLAMGSLAQPVLKTVIQTTRDASHRRQVALLLVQMGDPSELALALDPLGDPGGFARYPNFSRLLDAVLNFSDRERKELLAAEAKLPDNPANQEFRLLLRVAACDVSQLERCLNSVEEYYTANAQTAAFNLSGQPFRRVLAGQVHADARAAPIALKYFLKPAAKLRKVCFEVLAGVKPDLLTGPVLLEAGEEYWSYAMAILRERKDHATIAAIIDRAPDSLWGDGPLPGSTPGARTRVARGPQSPLPPERRSLAAELELLTKLDPAAQPASFGAVLRALGRRGPVTPGSLSFFPYHDEALPDLEAIVRSAAAKDYALAFNQVPWPNFPKLSPAFLELFRRLAVDADATVRQKVLSECLEHLLPYDPELVPILGRLLTDPQLATADDGSEVRSLLIIAAGTHRDRSAEAARILMADYEQSGQAYSELDSRYRLYQPGLFAVLIALVRDVEGKSSAAFVKWVLGNLERLSRSRRPAAVSGGPPPPAPPQLPVSGRSRATQEMAEWFPEFIAACKAAIAKDGQGPRRETLARIIAAGVIAAHPSEEWREDAEIARFLDQIIADAAVTYEVRLAVLRRRAAETPFEVLKEFLAKGDEETSDVLSIVYSQYDENAKLTPELDFWLKDRPEDQIRESLAIVRKHPDPRRRAWATRLVSQFWKLDDALGILKDSIRDPAKEVREAAVEVLGGLNDYRIGPILAQALADPEEPIRQAIIPLLGDLGSAEALEGLVRALEDQSPRIRRAALEALQKIKKQQEERDEWKKWLNEREEKQPPPAKER
jgi:hypothetical protein